MSKKRTRRFGDPRKAGGAIAGPGGPHARHSVVLDTRRAVLLDNLDVALLDEKDGQLVSMALAGRINRTTERTEILYLFDEDGAAAIVTELLALAARIGPAFQARFTERLDALLAAKLASPAPTGGATEEP